LISNEIRFDAQGFPVKIIEIGPNGLAAVLPP
jgi:hypothetical protein